MMPRKLGKLRIQSRIAGRAVSRQVQTQCGAASLCQLYDEKALAPLMALFWPGSESGTAGAASVALELG
jgi:hypothetical protein